MTSVRDASIALGERKVSAHGKSGGSFGEAEARRLLVGLDLDVDELRETAWDVVEVALPRVVQGEVTVPRALHGMWADGLLTGLLLAEMRSRESES